jgi:hypothetical protein
MDDEIRGEIGGEIGGQGPGHGRVDVEVVIPLRWDEPGPEARCRVAEMTCYLSGLATAARHVTVVDGSNDARFAEHATAWGRHTRVVRPGTARAAASNGKVVAAMTGLRLARSERVILADDDVRLSADHVRALAGALDELDLVRPVNVFDAWPWHARWDAARTLVNSAIGFDWPGVCALRRTAVLERGGWSEEALFENLELWRTMKARGARVSVAPDVIVPRRPPTARHFRSQRVRQAYDDLAQPPRLLAELLVLPVAVTVLRRSVWGAGVGVGALVLTAEVGRRRLGTRHVPPTVPLFAPLWLAERGVCVWLALVERARGGVPYHGARLRLAAHSVRSLRR